MKKRTLVAAFVLVMCLGLTGCGSTVAQETDTYFGNVGKIVSTMFSSSADTERAETLEESGTKLDTPTDFVVDEEGNYSFTGVENADYYLLYFCEPDATDDSASYVYSSSPIYSNDSNTYSGLFRDAFEYAYGEYLVKVLAFPELTSEEYTMSSAATATYTYTGEQSAPEIGYYWDTFNDLMTVQVINMGTYEFEAYPDYVDVTFTGANGDLTLTIEDLAEGNSMITTDQLTKGDTYSITAVATSTDEFVTNPTSDEAQVASDVTLGDDSIYVGMVSYTDGFANDIFSYPIVCTDFDLQNGGSCGTVMAMFSVMDLMTTPRATSDGSVYSYDLIASTATGSLELYADGTFYMDETGNGPINASSIEGTWHENGDGTATLNYNHNTLIID